ncbi:type II toxin-antitoxin system death-on-curing family toxin [Carbonactinospora thermoautotrophica]|uniref:type II toxin-antitoxin system death-on-curing family toxin n=1 Tax=Carbonactinospora thermoautotrophica TaxID=1469144 RepID=UPI00099EBD25|nr:type II toxin-antitoxin system death-on-curing family toxin [Carbonactinospora thermoautotrophica]
MTIYLTPDEVQRIHDREIGEEGLPGVDRGRLEAAVCRCQATVFGEDAFPTIHDKAAALFAGIIKNHPFADGNKRTAVLATYVFYALNGYTLVAEAGEIVALALATAQGYIDLDETRYEVALETIAARLAGWAQPIKFYDPALDEGDLG